MSEHTKKVLFFFSLKTLEIKKQWFKFYLTILLMTVIKYKYSKSNIDPSTVVGDNINIMKTTFLFKF